MTKSWCFDAPKTQYHISHAVAGLVHHITQTHEALQGMGRPKALNLVYSVKMEAVLLPVTLKSGLCTHDTNNTLNVTHN